jgi:hypothetical protein
MDKDKGTIYFGVSDFNEVTGIPLLNKTAGDVEAYVCECIDKVLPYIMGVGVEKEVYTSQIQVEVSKLDIDMCYISDTSKDIISDMNNKLSIYHDKYTAFLHERDNWIEELRTYTCSLESIINSKRAELIEYICIHCDDTYIKECVLKKLHNEDEELYIKVNIATVEKIKETADPYDYMFWLFRFKDDVVDNLMQKRPVPPLSPKCFNVPIALMTHLTDLRWKFIMNNKDMCYYVVKISLPCNVGDPSKYLQYLHPIYNVWVARTREYDESLANGPSCGWLGLEM